MNSKVRKHVTWSYGDFELSHEPIEDSITVEETNEGFTIKYLVQDGMAENPFLDWDGEGRIVFHPKSRYECNKDDWDEAISNKYAVPLDAYIHGGISLSVSGEGMQCRFDTSHSIAVWIPDKYSDVKTKKKAIERARQACELYNSWANGDVYGCCIDKYDKDKHHIDSDSCWGYFGYDNAKEALKTEY